MLPENARGVVLFAHGSGSSRQSPRNQQVANGLHDAGFATLLLDLLTVQEETVDLRTRELRFDIARLAERLADAVEWLAANPVTAALPVGVFGSSTGAAAALITAARQQLRVHAVVSRGGRPDLAGDDLERVRAPVLLVVGGEDRPVIDLNMDAARRLERHEVEIVAGATHLFEEPGALERVTELATRWFQRWLTPMS